MAASRVSWLSFVKAGAAFSVIAAGGSTLAYEIKPVRDAQPIELMASSAAAGENFANLKRQGQLSSVLMEQGKIAFLHFTATSTDRRVDMDVVTPASPANIDLYNDKAAGTMDVTGHFFLAEEVIGQSIPPAERQGREHQR